MPEQTYMDRLQNGDPAGAEAPVSVERYRAIEGELSDLKGHLQSLLQTARGFYFYRVAVEPGTPPRLRVVLVSPSILDVMGIKDAQDFESWFTGLHPDDKPRIMEAHQHSAATGALFDQEARWYHAGRGEWVWLRAMSQPLYNAGGVLTHFNGICIDITTQNRSEEALARSLERLQEAERRYRTVAEFTHDWEYWEGPDGAMRYVSPACMTVTGYSPGDFAEDPNLLHRIVLAEDLPVWRAHREEAFGLHDCAPVQFRIVRRDGGIRWLEHACRPVMAEDNAFLGFRGSNRDITDRKQTEAELVRQRWELARVGRVNALGELAAALAHELNQPLAAARIDTETAKMMLEAQTLDVNGIRAVLDDIAASQELAGEIVHRVRSHLTPAVTALRPMDVNTLAEESVRLVQSRAAVDGIRVTLALQPDLPSANGNRVQIVQVLINLMLNAFDAMKESATGQREVIVTSRCRPDGRIAVAVSDTGPGVPPEKQAAIFESFYTTKVGGMGMGLAVCRSIATAHGGELEVSNNPDGGATFTFVLPAARTGAG